MFLLHTCPSRCTVKEIAQKKDKGVSRIAANVIMIVIGIFIGATMVTMVGSVTHDANTDVTSMNATTQEIKSLNGEYNVYLNVTFSTAVIDTGRVMILINGTNDGIFSTFLNDTSSKASDSLPTPMRIGNGSDFRFNEMHKVMSLELLYEGNVIFDSGTISIIYHKISDSVISMSATTSEICSSSSYTVYFNVTSVSSSIAASQIGINVNGASAGTLAAPSATVFNSHSGPAYLTGGSNFEFHSSSKITSLELIYKGNVIVNSGTISIIYYGSGNSLVSVGATTSEVTSASGYTVYVNVSSSSSSLTTSSLTITINGATQGSFSSFLSEHRVNLTHGSSAYTNPTTLTGGSNFEFNNTKQITSFELIYKGNVIVNSGTITIS